MRDSLVTVREAAKYMRVSARTVYRLIESGQISAVRIGKQWRIPSSDLPGNEAIASQQTSSPIAENQFSA